LATPAKTRSTVVQQAFDYLAKSLLKLGRGKVAPQCDKEVGISIEKDNVLRVAVNGNKLSVNEQEWLITKFAHHQAVAVLRQGEAYSRLEVTFGPKGRVRVETKLLDKGKLVCGVVQLFSSQ